MLQRKALTHQHVRSRSCLLHGKRRRVRPRTRGEAVGQIALDLGPARHRHIPHHAQRPSCHGSVRAAAPVADPPDDVESGAFQQACQSLAKQNVIVGHHHAHRTTHFVIFRQCRPPVSIASEDTTPAVALTRRISAGRYVQCWANGGAIGVGADDNATGESVVGPMDSVSVQTPTVVTSDISTRNSPSSTGVTSTPTSVTRIEQGVRRD
jgi:hypothetical protein